MIADTKGPLPRILLAALLMGCALSAPALAVDIVMDVDAGAVACNGIVDGIADCDVTGAVPSQITVTWSISSSQVLNGYDLNVSWDPNELELVASSQLWPDALPPNTIAFLIEPSQGAAVMLSVVALTTTALFSATFDVVGPLTADGAADITWNANGNGLAPAPPVFLDNPGGASVDLSDADVRQCSDGVDNDNDGRIDFDGGAFAGLPVGEQTFPDAQCTSASDDREAAASSCGLGPEVALVLAGLQAARRRRGQARS